MREGTTLPLPLLFPDNSAAPTKSRSSSCRIIKSAKIGFLAQVDGLASIICLATAGGRMVTIGGYDGGAVLVYSGSVEAVEGVAVGRIGGVG